MNVQSLVIHLEDTIALEIESKRTALAWIERLEGALSDYDPDRFAEVVEDGAAITRGDEGNTARRQRLLGQLAGAWSVPQGTLTLGGIARRLGEGGARLEVLREDLRQAVSEVLRRRRRLSALIGMHQRINSDLMQLVLGCESEEELAQGGSLINAEV